MLLSYTEFLMMVCLRYVGVNIVFPCRNLHLVRVAAAGAAGGLKSGREREKHRTCQRAMAAHQRGLSLVN